MREIFLIFLRLGLTSFGGPIAHLAYFRQEFVTRRAWLSEHAYAELVALCQFLPGPASSKVGMLLGWSQGGVLGAIAAWLGFTLPSALALVWIGLAFDASPKHYVIWHGLLIITVAVVAQAVLTMGKALVVDKWGASIAISACVLVSMLPSASAQFTAIAFGGTLGALRRRSVQAMPHSDFPVTIKRSWAICALVAFVLLFGLPIFTLFFQSGSLQVFAKYYHVGALVFGGGHVVLPLLQAQVVPSGWVSNNDFLFGYGAAQAIPGPLFSFAAYLGAISSHKPSGYLGASISLVAIFLPSFLLIIGVLPFWERWRRFSYMPAAIRGANAAVVGILLAALYQPVGRSAILNEHDFFWAVIAFVLLVFWKTPAWLLVCIVGISSL